MQIKSVQSGQGHVRTCKYVLTWGTTYPHFGGLYPQGYNEIHIRLQHLEILLPLQFATTMTLKI